MKKLILILFLFSSLVHAENWLNHSKIKSGSVEAYSLKSDCEKISGEKCYDVGVYPSSVYSEISILVDDYSKPILNQSGEISGYEQKSEKSIQLDEAKLSAWQSQEAIKASERAREMAIQTAIARIECGKRVIGLLIVRNSTKSLTTGQVGQINSIYSPIKGLIDTGSLVTAKEQMLAITPDGSLIAQEDKDELLAEITKCI